MSLETLIETIEELRAEFVGQFLQRSDINEMKDQAEASNNRLRKHIQELKVEIEGTVED